MEIFQVNTSAVFHDKPKPGVKVKVKEQLAS